MKQKRVWLEITNLVVPSWTDDPDMIKRMCGWLEENPLHFSRFQPLYKLTQLPPTPVAVLKSAREIAPSEGLKHVYIGNVHGLNAENTICPKCKKVVVQRKGYAILRNNITNGKFNFCGSPVAGVWN